MTPPSVNDPEALRRILTRTEVLLLDFDGPVCNLFAGVPASVVVDQLCVVLADGGYGDPPPYIEKSADPFDVLKYAATLGDAEARYVNAAFTAHEVEAVATAEPTANAHNLMGAWSATGRPLAIVSNNSVMAVRAYLDRHELRFCVNYVSGRRNANLALLKPNPHLLMRALSSLQMHVGVAAFIGDSTTDVAAGLSAGVPSIGYANKPGKSEALIAAGADAVSTDMSYFLNAVWSM